MRNLLMAAATGALLVAAVPASAQVYMGADPGGAGVQVGPFGFGVGPRYGYDRWRGDEYRGDAYYAYGAECPLVKERIVTADGRNVFWADRSLPCHDPNGDKIANERDWVRKTSSTHGCP